MIGGVDDDVLPFFRPDAQNQGLPQGLRMRPGANFHRPLQGLGSMCFMFLAGPLLAGLRPVASSLDTGRSPRTSGCLRRWMGDDEPTRPQRPFTHPLMLTAALCS